MLTGLSVALSGCGSGNVASPFVSDAGVDAADADAQDAPPGSDAQVGRPCVDDAQCDDAIPCTFDRCSPETSRCVNSPDDTLCLDAVYCDGQEVCDALLGCVEGEPITCSDKDTCTIDACDEASLTCSHRPRDADGDGDPDRNCGGGDCNDTRPEISSLLPEICGNNLDDDCDGTIDEAECSAVGHDDCADALDVLAPGTYQLSTAGAAADHSASCRSTTSVDVVAAIVVPGQAPMDVDLIARGSSSLELAMASLCGDPSSELACNASVVGPSGGFVSRLWRRSLAPGAYPAYLFAPPGQTQELSVAFRPASSAPVNETCGSAESLPLGEHRVAQVVGVQADLASKCSAAPGELVYKFSLNSVRDVRVFAASVDGVGDPSISLRKATCADLSSEIVCHTGPNAQLFARALEPGTYYLAVSASAPSEIDVVVEASAPSTPPVDEDCSSPPTLVPAQQVSIDLSTHVSDVDLRCLPGAADAVYALDVPQPSDLLVVQRLSSDSGAVGLLAPSGGQSCGAEISCVRGDVSPVRLRRHGLAAGQHQIVAASVGATPVELTAFLRPASPPVLVAFADTCDQALQIPEEGGFFQGNTVNSTADYSAGCDFGVQPPGGAADQMLRLTLTAQRRVIFDMQGSGFQTLLNVRKGPSCPGAELSGACSVGYSSGRSYLDLVLEAGDYFVQVDGYNRASGPWYLDVFVVSP